MTKDHRRVDAQMAQEILEAEMTEHIGAASYERSTTRTGHSDGHKPRTLRTRVGTLNLSVHCS
jgi:putative transposase